MESPGLPGSVPVPQLVQALLRLDQPAADLPRLLALLGQELGAMLEGQASGAVRLRLDGGQLLDASGELPFPEGTRLRLAVDQGEGQAPRLRVVEARPPAAPALLAPLVGGEAEALASRLAAAEPLPGLEPLLRLLRSVGDPASVSEGSPVGLEEALLRLPSALKTALVAALDLPEGADSTALLLAFRRHLASGDGEPEPMLLRSARGGLGLGVLRLVERATGHLPSPEMKDALVTWFRTLETPPELPRQALPASAAETGAGVQRGGAAPAHPATEAEVWERWIRTGTETLAHPAASPREAPFHALQAREGTAFFELPLPWAGVGPLELWVERDAPEAGRGSGQEEGRRVLLGLHFSALGETRVGLVATPGRLRVRVWAEHPEVLDAERERLQAELEASGAVVELHVQALPAGPVPSLRALASGGRLHAMG